MAAPSHTADLASLDEATPAKEPTDAKYHGEFEALYAEHFAFVWRSLRRLGVPAPHLDDAAQDVFIVALRRSHEFRGSSSYRTWLFGIASNVAREQRRKGERSTLHEPLNAELKASEPTPHERLDL